MKATTESIVEKNESHGKRGEELFSEFFPEATANQLTDDERLTLGGDGGYDAMIPESVLAGMGVIQGGEQASTRMATVDVKCLAALTLIRALLKRLDRGDRLDFQFCFELLGILKFGRAGNFGKADFLATIPEGCPLIVSFRPATISHAMRAAFCRSRIRPDSDAALHKNNIHANQVLAGEIYNRDTDELITVPWSEFGNFAEAKDFHNGEIVKNIYCYYPFLQKILPHLGPDLRCWRIDGETRVEITPQECTQIFREWCLAQPEIREWIASNPGREY
jgi:hypothetical protein